MAGPDRQFWQDRFERGETPWDRGGSNPQLLDWLAQGHFAEPALGGGAVAVPGCGSGYEVAELARAGVDVIGIDYAEAPSAATRRRLDDLGLHKARVVTADVLQWRPDAALAAVYEQTCLCALHPDHWRAYADALHAWLRPGGRLFVLAMQRDRPGAAQGFVEGPPYHVHVNALRALFDAAHWAWPSPPYRLVEHPKVGAELALVLTRR